MNDESRIFRADRRGPQRIPAARWDAQLSAAEILRAAEADAAQLRAAAQRELDGVQERAAVELEAARARARAEGYAEANARAAQELLAIAAARESALREDRVQLERSILLIARALAGEAFQADPRLLARHVEALLSRVRRARRVSVRVHPADAERLESRLAELRASSELAGALELVADAALERGDIVLESELGELDARIATRLETIARRLEWEPL